MMRPRMDTVDRMALGLVLMFGSLLLGLALGALVGRFTRFEWGAATALLSLAAGGLGGAAWVASYYRFESVSVVLARTGCTERSGPERRGQPGPPFSVDRFGFVTPEGRELTLLAPERGAPCADDARDAPRPLRYLRRLAAAPGVQELPAQEDDDPRAAVAGPAVLAVFGGFGLLAGLFFVATARRQARIERLGPAADAPRPVGPVRRRLAVGLTVLGNLTLLGGVLAAAMADVPEETSTVWLFGAVAAACGVFVLAMAARRTLRLDVFLMWLIIGLGFGLAAWSVRVLA